MTLEKLTNELDDVKESIAASLMEGDDIHSLKSIALLQSMILNQPLNADTLVNVRLAWVAIQNQNTDGHRASILLRIQHATSMLYNYTMWNWLDVHLAGVATSILKGGDAGEDQWLEGLIDSICEMFDLRIESYTYYAINYGLSLPGAEHTLRCSKWPRTGKTRQSAIVQAVVEIVQKWLSFPEQQNARVQAWFLHAIISQFGVEILLLDHIWHTHAQVTRTLFRQGPWRLDSFADVQPLVDIAPSHPLFNKHSPERTVVSDLANLIHRFAMGQIALQESDAPESTVTTPIDKLPTELRSSADAKMNLFRDFLQDSVGFVVSNSPSLTAVHPTLASTNPKFPILRKAMSENPDFTLPFREMAPGRIHISQPDGPFHSTVIRTTRGIYSALIWRAITFNTPFAAAGPKIFNSYADFERARARAGPQPPEYFCNKAAYGVTDHGRVVENSRVYWDALQGDLWPNFVRDRMLSFRECYDFFSFKKNGTRFGHLGILGSYLITADLVYAGVVDPPGDKDIGWIVHHLNKGAMSALIELGLVSRPPPHPITKKPTKPKQEECEKGVRRIFQIMMEVVPAELHTSLIVDLIAVEHSLCKFGRALKRFWLKPT